MKPLVLALTIALCTALSVDAGHAADPATSAAANTPTIKLVDAGTGKKKVLRFTAKKGMKQVLIMTMAMGMTIDLGGSPVKQRIPVIKMAMDIVVTDVAKNGDIRYAFKLREPEIVADASTAPSVVEAMKAAVRDMVGMSGNAVVSSRGFTKHADIEVPAGANAQTTQLFESLEHSIAQMSAPVPEEAVGVGAKWETTMKLAQNGVSLVQVATTELVSLRGNVIGLKVAIAQSAVPQQIKTNGVTVDLQSYKGSGGGESTINLGRLVPKLAKVTLKSDMQMKAGAQRIAMGLDVAMTMASQ